MTSLWITNENMLAVPMSAHIFNSSSSPWSSFWVPCCFILALPLHPCTAPVSGNLVPAGGAARPAQHGVTGHHLRLGHSHALTCVHQQGVPYLPVGGTRNGIKPAFKNKGKWSFSRRPAGAGGHTEGGRLAPYRGLTKPLEADTVTKERRNTENKVCSTKFKVILGLAQG